MWVLNSIVPWVLRMFKTDLNTSLDKRKQPDALTKTNINLKPISNFKIQRHTPFNIFFRWGPCDIFDEFITFTLQQGSFLPKTEYSVCLSKIYFSNRFSLKNVGQICLILI